MFIFIEMKKNKLKISVFLLFNQFHVIQIFQVLSTFKTQIRPSILQNIRVDINCGIFLSGWSNNFKQNLDRLTCYTWLVFSFEKKYVHDKKILQRFAVDRSNSNILKWTNAQRITWNGNNIYENLRFTWNFFDWIFHNYMDQC